MNGVLHGQYITLVLIEISLLQDLKVDQKTPIRVLHRRPLAVREKIIHSISATRVDDHHFTMLIRTGAGTYPFLISGYFN
jgi:tRNA pseudouridine synthase 10